MAVRMFELKHTISVSYVLCVPLFRFVFGQACPSGFYGKNCTLKCGACENVACHQNGTCVTGCEEGWQGDSCIELKLEPSPEQALAENEGGNTGTIVGVSLVGTALFVVCVAALLFVMNKRRQSRERVPNVEEAKTLTQDPEIVTQKELEVEEPGSEIEEVPEEPVEQTPAVEKEEKGESSDEEEESSEKEEESQEEDKGKKKDKAKEEDETKVEEEATEEEQ